MAIKGSLKEAGLADVCQLLAMSQKSGCLSVTDRSRFGQIYFDRGRITFATIINRRERLGDLLVRQGAITADQLRHAIDAQARAPDRRLGELLLEQGAVGADTLTAAIREQIEDAIFYLFTWSRGNFYFEVGKSPDVGEILISVPPETLLLEGARRVDEWSVIEKKIGSMDLIFDLDRHRLDRAAVTLTAAQEQVASLLDGERTAEEIAEASGLGEFETGKAVYGLIQAGYAHRVGRREVQAVASEPADMHEARNLGVAFYRTSMLDDAEREFRRVLEVEPHDPEARHYLALIPLRVGDPAEAIRRLSALLESSGPRLGPCLNLALALRQRGRHSEAIRVLAEAHRIAPKDPRVVLAEGATRLFAGDTERAATLLADYRRMLPKDDVAPATYYYCAGLADAVGARFDAAEAVVDEGLGAHPVSAPLLLLAGNIAERRSDMEAAEQSYRQAADEDPRLAQVHKNLGDLAARRSAAGEALDHYRRAAELEPDLGDDLYARMGDLHYRRNEREDAIRCWRRALELNPENEAARNHLEVVAKVKK